MCEEQSTAVTYPRIILITGNMAAGKSTVAQDEAEIAAFDHILHTSTPRLGYWLDSSDLTVAETVAQIWQHLPHAALQ